MSPEGEAGRGRSSLFRNTFAQSAGLIAGSALSFLLAPLMLSRLGLDKFGVWAVTGAFATYAGLLDLGVGRSLIRFVAVFDSEEREDRIAQCVGLGLLAVTAVAVPALAGAALLAPVLSDKLGVLDEAQMRAVAMASAGIWTLNGYQSVLSCVALGKRRMVPPNLAFATGSAINFALSVAALLASTSLVVYAFANVVAALLALIPGFLAMRFVWHRPYWRVPPRRLVREVLSYGVKDQVGWIAELINLETDKVVIALLVDIRAAAVYEIVARVVAGVRSVAIMSVSAMIPTAAARIVSEGREVIGPMLRRYTRLSCGVSFPLFMLAACTAPFLLVAWLGRAPGDSEILVPFLTFAFVFNSSTGAATTIARGAGKPGVVASNEILIALLNVLFTVALAPALGLWGVVAGTVIAISAGSMWMIGRVLGAFGLPWADFLGSAGPPALVAIAAAVAPAVVSILVGAPPDRAIALLLLAGTVPLYALPYWALATRLDLLPAKLRFPRMRPSASTEGVA